MLNITRPAIKQQISNLEKNLETALISRDQPLRLTEEGKKLSKALEHAFQNIDVAISDIVKTNQNETVVITMTPSFASEWMAPRMQEFSSACPNINLEINPSFAQLDLQSEKIDLGIRFGDGSWTTVKSKLWKKTEFIVVVAKDVFEKHQTNETIDLSKVPWLQELGSTEVEDWADRKSVEYGFKPELRFMPGHMILPAMRDGCGIACTARLLVEEDIRNEAVHVIDREMVWRGNLGYYIVTPLKNLKPETKCVIDWFNGHLS